MSAVQAACGFGAGGLKGEPLVQLLEGEPRFPRGEPLRRVARGFLVIADVDDFLEGHHMLFGSARRGEQGKQPFVVEPRLQGRGVRSGQECVHGKGCPASFPDGGAD